MTFRALFNLDGRHHSGGKAKPGQRQQAGRVLRMEDLGRSQPMTKAEIEQRLRNGRVAELTDAESSR